MGFIIIIYCIHLFSAFTEVLEEHTMETLFRLDDEELGDDNDVFFF